MAGWTTAGLYDRFLSRLGRGNAGVMAADELWTATRTYETLADAQEAVYSDIVPMCPNVFVSAPVQLTTSDGGITYNFATFPFGHVEVFAQLSGGRQLLASTYGTPSGDFIFEGSKLRSPGNRVRSYTSGPYARYTGFPTRIASGVEPSLVPAEAGELILYRALILACDVWGAELDSAPFKQAYSEARMRWVTLWKTQDATAGAAGRSLTGSWWLSLSANNG